MSHFTPIPALLGGALIGLAAALLLLTTGRFAAISGIVSGVVRANRGDLEWRALFAAGLVLGGTILYVLGPERFGNTVQRSTAALVVSGLLVGFGTRLGGGCTSGHGVCGLARFSGRSLVATLVFMGAGAVTVFVIQRGFGGVL